MKSPQNADAHARSSLRKLRRDQRKRAKIYRICETAAVVIVWIAFLLQLISNASDFKASKQQSRNSLTRADDLISAATHQLTPVPEPSAGVFVVAGMVAIYFWRRKNQIAHLQKITPLTFQPSKIATAAA